MPASKVCGEPGCPELISSGSYCDAHTTHNWDTSTRKSPPGWRRMRARVLRRDRYRCVICGRSASVVDHLEPMAWGGAGLEASNLRAMCMPCHKAKTNQEKLMGRRRNVMSRDEWESEKRLFIDGWRG